MCGIQKLPDDVLCDILKRIPLRSIDDVLCDILKRIPLRSIYSSRAVSKSWNTAIAAADWSQVWDREEVWVHLVSKQEDAKHHLWCPPTRDAHSFPIDFHPFPTGANILLFLSTSQGLNVYYMKNKGYLVANLLRNECILVGLPEVLPAASPDLHVVDAEYGIYKLACYGPTGMHIYDSTTNKWEYLETPQEFLDMGFQGCTAAAESDHAKLHDFPVPTCYVKQFIADHNLNRRKGGDLGVYRWKKHSYYEGVPSHPRAPEPFRFHVYGHEGRCIGVVCKRFPDRFDIWVHEYVGGKWEVLCREPGVLKKPLGVEANQEDVHIIFGAGMAICMFYDQEVPPVFFYLKTLIWKELGMGYNFIAIAAFKPNVLTRPYKILQDSSFILVFVKDEDGVWCRMKVQER